VILNRSVVDTRAYAQMVRPRKSILLLRGHVKPPKTVISEVITPPYVRIPGKERNARAYIPKQY
jgi:hypothetical protein